MAGTGRPVAGAGRPVAPARRKPHRTEGTAVLAAGPVAHPDGAAGGMLAFIRKKFDGSQVAFKVVSRLHCEAV